jgi:DNA polymerase III subunit delta
VAQPDLPAAVTLVTGEEEFLVAREVSRVLTLVRESDPAVDIRDLAATEVTPEALADALNLSLFGDRRVIVVRDVEDSGKEVHDALTHYAAQPLDETSVILTHRGGAKGKALLSTLAQCGARVVELSRVRRPAERADFVRAEVRDAGGRITEGAVRAVLSAVGTDLRDLAMAVGQLVADTGGQVDDDAVARYYRGKAEASGFVIADRAVEGDTSGALEMLRWGLAVGLAPVLVTSALAANVRAIAKVAAAGRGSPATLAKQLGMPAWKVERTQRQARGWRPQGLAAALAAVAAADGDVKGGGADPAYALERAILQITAARER